MHKRLARPSFLEDPELYPSPKQMVKPTFDRSGLSVRPLHVCDAYRLLSQLPLCSPLPTASPVPEPPLIFPPTGAALWFARRAAPQGKRA